MRAGDARHGSLLRAEDLAAHCTPDEIDATRDGVEPVSLFAVGGQDSINGVRRKLLAQPGAHNPVAVAGPHQARINVLACDKHENGRVFPQDRFRPVVRREDIEQLRAGGLLPAVGVWCRDGCRPSRRQIHAHIRRVTPGRTRIRELVLRHDHR
jgi:hypothetical protein